MKLNQKGAVDLIFVAVLIVLLAAGAFTLWRIQSADETVSETAANTSEVSIVGGSNTSEDVTSSDSGANEDYSEYGNSEIGVQFSYPNDWGDVSVIETTAACQEAIARSNIEIEGEQYELGFSANEDVTLLLTAKNYSQGFIPCLLKTDHFHANGDGFDDVVVSAQEIENDIVRETGRDYILFQDEKLIVLREDDSYEGAYSEYLLAGAVDINSTKYGYVSFVLQREPVNQADNPGANSYPPVAGYDDLNFTEMLRDFVNSLQPY